MRYHKLGEISIYVSFQFNIRQEKKGSNRNRLTFDRNRINYYGKNGIPTSELPLIKIMLNSVISTLNAKFMTIDISNFYLNTTMKHYK